MSWEGLSNVVLALKSPSYGLYAAGNSVSLIGTWMQRVAVGWLTWELTGSGAWLGVVAFAELFPTVLIAPFAGVLADRRDRLTVMRVAQGLLLVQALALFVLTASGAMTIWILLGLTLYLGVVAAIAQPVRLALVPSLVPREHLSAAVAINSIIFNGARFLGPAAAGVIIVSGGIAAAFAANAASFVWFLFVLSRLRVAPDGQASTAGRSVLAALAEGLAYTARHPGIGPLLALLLAVSLCARPVVELLPGFAGAVFAAGAEGLAAMTATIGLGAIAAGLWLAQRDSGLGLVRVTLLAPLGMAAALGLFVASPGLWLALPALFLVGVAAVTAGVGTQTLLQLSVASELRGRVLSLYGLIFRGGPALGALVMGGLSEILGLRWPLAGGVLLAALAWALVWVRRERVAAALKPGTG